MPGMSKLKKPDAPLCRALATLVVLLAVSVLVWLALVRPQLGKGRSETISDDYSASTILQDGQTASQIFTFDQNLLAVGVEFYLPGGQPEGELEVVLTDADTGEELARSTGVDGLHPARPVHRAGSGPGSAGCCRAAVPAFVDAPLHRQRGTGHRPQ